MDIVVNATSKPYVGLYMNDSSYLALWQAGNNEGDGYIPDFGGDDVHAAAAAYEGEGATVLHWSTTDDDVTVLDYYGVMIAIGDAHGPWAVTIDRGI